jgi:hypothetical protein
MKTQATCFSCKENGCDIRGTCPDDETNTERRKQAITEWL